MTVKEYDNTRFNIFLQENGNVELIDAVSEGATIRTFRDDDTEWDVEPGKNEDDATFFKNNNKAGGFIIGLKQSSKYHKRFSDIKKANGTFNLNIVNKQTYEERASGVCKVNVAPRIESDSQGHPMREWTFKTTKLVEDVR